MKTILIFGLFLGVFHGSTTSPLDRKRKKTVAPHTYSQRSDGSTITDTEPSYKKALDGVLKEIDLFSNDKEQKKVLIHMLAKERVTYAEDRRENQRLIQEKDRIILENERIYHQLMKERNDLVPYKAVLVLRSKIEDWENTFYPWDNIPTTNRYKRWMVILHCGDIFVEPILQLVRSLYSDLKEEDAKREFATALQKIYGDLCDSPPRIFDQKILNRIRENDKELEDFFTMIGIPYEESVKKAVQILARPLPLAKSRSDKSEITEMKPIVTIAPSFRCLEIMPCTGNFQRNPKDNDTEVFEFFYTRQPILVVYKPAVVSSSTHMITSEKFIVMFETLRDAIEALSVHADNLKNMKVKLRLDDCSRLLATTTEATTKATTSN